MENGIEIDREREREREREMREKRVIPYVGSGAINEKIIWKF